MEDAFEKTAAIIGTKYLSKIYDIEKNIASSELFILCKKRFSLRMDQAEYLSSLIFKDRSSSVFIKWVTSGPIQVLIIGGCNAVARLLDLIYQNAYSSNCIRGSPSLEIAAKEIRFFFPETRFELDLGLNAKLYLSETVYPKLLEGLVMLSREKPPIPVLWLAEWLLENRPHEQ